MDDTLDDEALEALLAPAAAPAGTAGAPPLEVRAAVAALVDRVRPADPAHGEEAARRLYRLAAVIRRRPAVQAELAARVAQWVRSSRSVPLFAEAGILSTRGFLSEIGDRLYERVLPAPPRPGDLRDAFAALFHHRRDGEWVALAPLEAWKELAAAVGLFHGDDETARVMRANMLQAAEVLAMRIAGEALQTELLHLDPDAECHDSPFLALQREVAALIAGEVDAAHAHVLIEQCVEGAARLRRKGRERGTSVRVTYLLERIEQMLRRLGLLLDATSAPTAPAREEAGFMLFADLVQASATRLAIAPVWRANTRLLAKRVTENASRTGEHYVSEDRADYFGMLRAAMGAGFFIALMALLKVQVKDLHLPPLVEAALVCADYAVGFVVIHLLHFTVATKQPAMTAATIAATLEESQGGRAKLDGLVVLIAGVTRTQVVAILGNVAVALPLAFAIATAWRHLHGAVLVPDAKAAAMLFELRPLAGWALAHAAVAGVWLFVAGLISGFYDNRCALLDIPARVAGSPLIAWVPAPARERLARYVDGNLGALMGNAAFGVLLGGTAFLGYLVGLPIDIRHVAFASANLGYATVTAGLGVEAFLLALLFVLMIGFVNLAVSFSLALNVALRARGVTFERAGDLARALWAALRRDPASFLLPPR